MYYLLDTNVISELRKTKIGRSDKNVVTWARNVASSSLFLSIITILELEIGILSIERKDSVQGNLLRRWLDKSVLPAFSDRILNLDIATVKYCAKLHVPNPKSERDAIIAATALAYNMTLVTRNTRDFNSTGVALHNPWMKTT